MPDDSPRSLSTIAKKFLMGATGLALVGFVMVHLAGNLLLLSPNPDLFNGYAHKLESLGALLYAAEAGLVLLFLIHIYSGITVSLHNRRARPQGYKQSGRAGGASRRSSSSTTMIWTGLALFAFLAWHLWEFKFGPGMEQGYAVQLGPEVVRDLHRLVVERFQIEYVAAGYVLVMALLGFHLRHGFWSAFQSLGLHHPCYTPLIYGLGVLLAVFLAAGFLFIPIWIFFA